MSQLPRVPELLVLHAEKRGHKVAFSAPGREITYSDLETRTRRIAVHLVRSGIGRGQFVAIVLGRCIEAVESVLAITRAGAVGVPLDPRSPPAELSNVLDHSGARAVITDSRHLSQVQAATEGSPGRMIIVVTSSNVATADGLDFVRYQDWTEDGQCATLSPDIDEDLGAEAAFLHYTSGTTSSPKGVLSSQQSWLWSAHSFASTFGLTEDDRFFWPLPLFHCLGHALCIIATVTVGASAHLADPNETLFDSLFTREALTATVIVGAPASYHEIVDAATPLKATLALPALRACMVAGSTAPASLSAQVQDLLGVRLLNNYGCSEACGAIAVNKLGDPYHEGSVGTTVPGIELRLVDPDGNKLEDGEQGEIWIRSPSLMIRYYKEEKTPFTADGWFPTGDIGSLSSNGTDLTFIGRKKELIVRGGENIQPGELEQVLLQCPGVSDVVVTGMPHRVLGETPAAFIVRDKSGSETDRGSPVDIDPNHLLAACRKVLPEYKVPTAFFEIDAVPRTLLGKPRRSAVKCHASRPLTAQSKLLSRDSIEALVLTETASACVTDARPGESSSEWLHLHSDQPFSALGLTSLAGVVLRDRLSSLTGLGLPTTLIFDYPTPESVSTYIYRRLFEPGIPSSLPTPDSEYSSEQNGIEPIAIVSMACRYPGGISSPEDLWRVVSEGIDVTSEFPDDRGWDLEALYDPDPDAPGTSTTRRGAFLKNMADFDAGLFGMSPREALATDPQQRLLLETTWELAERGGIAPSSLRGSQTGVFVGIMYGDYGDNGKDNPEFEAHVGIGSSGAVVSGRISYCFGLNGPSLCIQTGCSSSLVAIHLAAASLRSGESSLAIAGGVTTMATPYSFVSFSKRRGLSADGRCRAYSSDADGTGWSEGVGLVLLERLRDARRNGHRVLGVIRGSAVNSDGASNGLTAPSGPAQQQVIRTALGQAALGPADVDVLEGHGTATPLGDPVEVQAVISAYGNGGGGRRRPDSRPLLLGSIKSNIGHTQAAAGVASIIKMVQAIQHGVAPASLHIAEPSRYIEWEGSGVELLTSAKQWPVVASSVDQAPRPRRAAVSSFGIGGTNSHVILEQAFDHDYGQAGGLGSLTPPTSPTTRKWPFSWLLSGTDKAALRGQAQALLASKTVLSQDPTDVAFSLTTTRSALRYRAAVAPDMGGNYEAALMALAQGQPHPDVVTGLSNGPASTTKPRLSFIFSGQGARLPGKAALEELCTVFPIFSAAFREACKELGHHLERPLESVLKESEENDNGPHVSRTDFAQACLFAFETAIFRLLESFDIRPDIVAGHSLGEITAAHVSGALSLREAATIVTARGKLMAALPSNGTMVSIGTSEEEVAEEISRHVQLRGGAASIAAVNSRNSVVVSGTVEGVMGIADRFAGQGRRVTQLRGVRHAFHSPMMDPILADLEEKLLPLMGDGSKATVPIVSSVTGARVESSELRSAAHWTRHVRQPVRFYDAVREIQNDGVSVFVEVGPSAMLSTHVPGAIATSGQADKLLGALGNLWVQGVQVDWRAVFRDADTKVVDLPVYAFQRRRYWLPPPKPTTAQHEDIGTLGHGILLHATSIPETGNIICSGNLSVARQTWLQDHVVGGQVVVPAAAFVEVVLRASQQCTGTKDSMALDELTFVAPLVMDPQGNTGIQVQVLMKEPDEYGSRTVDVYSCPSSVPPQHDWTRNATGTLKLASPPTNTSKEAVQNTGSISDEDRGSVDISRAYSTLADTGISYGPSFQCVRAVWGPQPDSPADNELRACIDLPKAHNKRYTLHPAVLDAALHAPLLAASDAAASDVRLPFLLRGVRIYAHAGPGPLMAQIRQLEEDRFSVTLTDKSTGAVVAEVSEVVTRARLRPAAVGPKPGNLYRLKWDECAQGTTSGGLSEPSNPTDDMYRVRCHFDHDVSVVRGVTENRVHKAVTEVLGTIQTWSANKAYSGGRLVIVTENATAEADPNLIAAAVWGFVRTAQAELSGSRVVLVDLDGSAESEAAVPAALASEEETVAIRRGRMMIPKLNKFSLASRDLITPTTSAALSSLDVSGTVLITGGTGGLGALLARHIARVYGAKRLLLVSRSGTNAPNAPKLRDELCTATTTVDIEACDCADREKLATLLASSSTSRGRRPPITSIIHCAGVVDDAVLISQSPERISRVLGPKVDAAWHLHELAPATVRSFVLFSSFVGILGNEGQAAYSAGNAFLDALARFRVSRGLPAVSLAWGPWLNEIGMAAENRLKVHNPRLGGAKPLTDQQGLQLFDMAMQRSTPPEPVMALLVVEGSFPLISEGHDLASKVTASGQGGAAAWRQKLAVLPTELRDEELSCMVRGEIASVLGYQDQGLPDRPLAELGFDSSTSVLLTNRLRRFTGLLDLPVTLALDCETISTLFQYLAGRLDIAQLTLPQEAEAETQRLALEETVTVASTEAAPTDEDGKDDSTIGKTDENQQTESEHVDTGAFQGLTTIYKRLCHLQQYTAAAGLLICASLALPRFKVGPDMASYAAAPQRLATGPTDPTSLAIPLVLIPSFLPPIVAEGFRGSAFSALAAEMDGERDVFELPHPKGIAVPEDLEALAAVHSSTIRRYFSGPIVLAGYSAGGLAAHAVASKLSGDNGDEQEEKIQLAGLILIDTYFNKANEQDPEWLSGLPAEALTNKDGVLLHMAGDSDLALAKMGGFFCTLQNLKLRPLPAALPTLLLRAQYPSSKMPPGEHEWRASWPRADTAVDIPGSHLELLDKRCASVSAGEIQQWLGVFLENRELRKV